MLLHAGRLTARGMCAVIAAMQPQDAIIVDESLTSGGAYWDFSKVHFIFLGLHLTMSHILTLHVHPDVCSGCTLKESCVGGWNWIVPFWTGSSSVAGHKPVS